MKCCKWIENIVQCGEGELVWSVCVMTVVEAEVRFPSSAYHMAGKTSRRIIQGGGYFS